MAAPTDVVAERIGVKGGRELYRASGSDSSIGSGDEEVAISGCPVIGTIVALRVFRSAGTGATVDPSVYRETAGTGLDILLVNDTAAATVDEQTTIRYYADDGVLYLDYGLASATADHTVAWEMLVADGWL